MAQPATCGECGRVCKSKNALTAHQRCHTKKYLCLDAHCRPRKPPVGFGTKRDLERHQRTHAASPKIRCHYCHAIVGRPDNLKRHIDNIHKGGIFMAAACGDEEAVMSCLIDNKFAQEKDEEGDIALCHAVRNDHESVVRILLDAGVGTEFPAKDPRPAALCVAMLHERHRIAELLISRGATINREDGTPSRELTRSAKEGNIDLVRRCLEKGGDTETTDSMGQTPLCWAFDNKDQDMLNLLVSNGASLNGRVGISLLLAAAKTGHAGFFEFGVLLEKTLGSGRCSHPVLQEILLDRVSQHEDILQLVVEKMGDTNLNLWVNVVDAGLDVAMRVLLQHYPYPRAARFWNRYRPLHSAALWGKLSAMRILLDEHVEIEEADTEGWTALHCAALHGNPAAVRLLLERGADRGARTRTGKTPSQFVRKHGQESAAIKQLLE